MAGAVLGPTVAGAAWRAGALSESGAVAAAVVGAVVVAAGGLHWAAILLAFFLSGSLLTAWRRRRQGRPRRGRDAAQVVANGGVAALAGLLRMAGGAHPVWDLLMAGSLAAMTADTWATEAGLMSGVRPRRLVDGTPVSPGESGAVSLPGTAAGLAGSLLMGRLAETLMPMAGLGVATAAGGVMGLFLDSLLGATAQARFACAGCGQTVEVPRRHRAACCGPVSLRSGLAWLDNDMVNLMAALAGGAGAVAWWYLA